MKKTIIITIILFAFSIINLKSYPALLSRQIIWFALGFMLFFILSKINKKTIIYGSYIMYFVINILLMYLLISGEDINGSRAWINLGIASFQPSEIMKMILIIILSIESAKYRHYRIRCLVITLIPAILTFLEPDTGNVFFYFVILATIFFASATIKKRIIIPLIILVITSIFSLIFLNFNTKFLIDKVGSNLEYRIERITSLFNNSSYQLKQALINIAISGPFGSKSTLTIPESTTDFAFALLIEKTGYVGLIVYLTANTSLNIIMIKNLKGKNGYDKKILNSFIILKITQESIHQLMNIGLFPITGITLPLVSYGGTSIIAYLMMLGIINNYNNNYHIRSCHMVEMVDKVE